MVILNSYLNPTNGVIDLWCDQDINMDVTVIVSDVYLDCVYHAFDAQIQNGSSVWVTPLSDRLTSMVLNNPEFAGYMVKVLDRQSRRLLQSTKLFLHRVEPKIKQHFHTPLMDITGPSYVDFFYGDLCQGIDCSGVVVDAGANVGFFTLYAKTQGAKRVYAIDPDPMPFYYLDRNFGMDENIIPINKAFYVPGHPSVSFDVAIYDSVGSTLTKNNDRSFATDHNYFHTFDAKITTDVQVITVSDLLKIEDRINLLKLDIEGAEFEVMESILPREWKRIDRLFIEYHGRPEPIEQRLLIEGYKVEYRHRNDQWISGSIGFIYATRLT